MSAFEWPATTKMIRGTWAHRIKWPARHRLWPQRGTVKRIGKPFAVELCKGQETPKSYIWQYGEHI